MLPHAPLAGLSLCRPGPVVERVYPGDHFHQYFDRGFAPAEFHPPGPRRFPVLGAADINRVRAPINPGIT